MKPYKIVLTGGGTAGHVVPNFALIPYLKGQADLFYIGSETGIEKELATNVGLPYYGVPCCKLVRRFTPKNLAIPFTLLKGVNKAEKILKTLSPDAVFSKGGYVALPVVIAASRLKIPVLSHESDVTVGLANRLAAKKATVTLTSFETAAKEVKNGLFIGPPIKGDLTGGDRAALLREYGFSQEKPTLLVLGGSSGARAINRAVRDALPLLLPRLNVLHISGKTDYCGNVRAPGYYETPFFTDMRRAYTVADVAVSRCGSNAAFELLSLNIPTVFIPLPKGVSRGDQEKNAAYFARRGLCSVLPESLLTPRSLAYAVTAAAGAKPSNAKIENAAPKIAEKIFSVIQAAKRRRK